MSKEQSDLVTFAQEEETSQMEVFERGLEG